MRLPLLFIGLAGTFTILFTGCIKNDFEKLSVDDWKPEVAAPLINSHFTAKDVINSFETGGLIQSDDDNIITLVYSGNLFSYKAKDIIRLPNLPFVFTDTTINTFFDFPNNERLTSLKLNSGDLEYTIRATSTEDVVVELTIPTAKKNSTVFRKTLELSHIGSNQLSVQGKYLLDDYQFYLTGESGTGYNEIDMRYKAYTKTSRQRVELDEFSGVYKNLEYNILSGYLGERSLGVSHDSTKVDLFENFKSGILFIDNPFIALTIANSFGIPATATITNLNGRNKNGTFPLVGSYFNNQIEINYPDISVQEATVETHRIIDKSNSEIGNFLALSPGIIEYGFDLGINADQPSPVINYVRDSSKITGSLELRIPFQGRIEHVVLTDTFDMSFSDVKEAESATFKILIDNSFPLDVVVQLYFLDSATAIIDSLLPYDERIFGSPMINENGIPVGSLLKETLIEVSANRFEQIKRTNDLALKVKFVSGNNAKQTVKFLDSSFLSVELGAIAKLNIESK